jgi:DNA-binding NtrC family response regulator
MAIAHIEGALGRITLRMASTLELGEVLAEITRGLVALRNSSGNQSEAARHLHVSRATLSYKMKAYGLGYSAHTARSHGATLS